MLKTLIQINCVLLNLMVESSATNSGKEESKTAPLKKAMGPSMNDMDMLNIAKDLEYTNQFL